MTVAQAAQDEVEAVRREMQEKMKAAQEFADRQVSVNDGHWNPVQNSRISNVFNKHIRVPSYPVLTHIIVVT